MNVFKKYFNLYVYNPRKLIFWNQTYSNFKRLEWMFSFHALELHLFDEKINVAFLI